MGLTNVTLLEKNIMDIDDDFGTFDYILVHGIWSWVPDVVRIKSSPFVIVIYLAAVSLIYPIIRILVGNVWNSCVTSCSIRKNMHLMIP